MVPQHPQRAQLHNEIHERPPEPMAAPLAISHIVMVCDAEQREASREHLACLLRDHHLAVPDRDATHLRVEIGSTRIRWELHTEFVSWTAIRRLDEEAFDPRYPASAGHDLPQDWLAELPGQCLVSQHLWALAVRPLAIEECARALLNEEQWVASAVAGGSARVYTDFAIHGDGFSRVLLMSGDLSPRRLGRLVQRLLEIETYRMAALLGLPVARKAARMLGEAESELAALAQAVRSAQREEEPALLDRLTRLAGSVEGEYASTHGRFSASAAYFELVDKRIAQIDEVRLPGLQTIGEFMDRRLSPARATCEWAARRHDALSQRISRVSNLLRTRVEIEQQLSSQALLETMNRRQDLQLKLQATVEGLSVAAITYYIVGLVSYLSKGAQKLGWPLSVETSTAVSVPVVALAVWWSMRRMHRAISGH